MLQNIFIKITGAEAPIKDTYSRCDDDNNNITKRQQSDEFMG